MRRLCATHIERARESERERVEHANQDHHQPARVLRLLPPLPPLPLPPVGRQGRRLVFLRSGILGTHASLAVVEQDADGPVSGEFKTAPSSSFNFGLCSRSDLPPLLSPSVPVYVSLMRPRKVRKLSFRPKNSVR